MTLLIVSSQTQADEIHFHGDAGKLQQVINDAPENATVVCDDQQQLVIAKTIAITKAITIKGLSARLKEKLGNTPMMIVQAEGVTLTGFELHGNYESVTQQNRAPIIWLQRGGFVVKDCKFYDASKDGIMVTPLDGTGDLVGGTIQNIEGFRLGRDAVSISGGNHGHGAKVRNLLVENVRIKVGYLRGAVEVSDGIDKVTVRNVYAEDAVYAIDVQDHRGDSAANTNVVIENAEAVRCRHIIRTANSPRGHAHLTLRNFSGRDCERPISISNTKDVTIDGLKIISKAVSKSSPISFKNCQSVRVKNVTIQGLPEKFAAVDESDCEDVQVEEIKFQP